MIEKIKIIGIFLLWVTSAYAARPAHEMLGVPPDATLEQIEAAYQNHPLRMNTPQECPICFEEVLAGEAFHPNCDCKGGEFYHSKCIDKWLREHATCPLCRQASVSRKLRETLDQAYQQMSYLFRVREPALLPDLRRVDRDLLVQEGVRAQAGDYLSLMTDLQNGLEALRVKVGSAAEIKAEAQHWARVAEESVSLAPDLADAYYYLAAFSIIRCEREGVIYFLSHLPQLRQYLRDATERNALAGHSGKRLDGGGPLRLLGKIYLKLPPMLGGSRSEAHRLLREVLQIAPDHPMNQEFYVE